MRHDETNGTGADRNRMERTAAAARRTAENDADRSTPKHVNRSLDHGIGVRIPASQPFKFVDFLKDFSPLARSDFSQPTRSLRCPFSLYSARLGIPPSLCDISARHSRDSGRGLHNGFRVLAARLRRSRHGFWGAGARRWRSRPRRPPVLAQRSSEQQNQRKHHPLNGLGRERDRLGAPMSPQHVGEIEDRWSP